MPPELDPAYGRFARRESPTEGMRRIERELRSSDFEYQDRPATQSNRLGSNAGRNDIEGYNVGIGAQGPLSAGLIGAGDPESGRPTMVGARAQAGPLSYQYTQPTQRGAPASQQVGVSVPFDDGAYFGGTVQQTPGQGRTYGANVGGEGWNVSGGYNPHTKGLNANVGYQTNFASGGRAVVGHTQAAGLPVSLEQHKGEMRHRAHSGNSRMAADYGYIDSSKPDHDGMKTDAYVGPHRDSKKIFVINQQHPHTGEFNEHKVMLGYKDRDHAVRDFTHSFSDGLGHKRIQSVVEMEPQHLKDWLKGSHTQPLRKADGGPITPVSLAAQMVPPEKQGPIDGEQAGSPSWEGVGKVLSNVGKGIDQIYSTPPIDPSYTTGAGTRRDITPMTLGEKLDPKIHGGGSPSWEGVGSALGHMAEDPFGTLGGLAPFIGNALAAKDTDKLSKKADELEAAGDLETAKKIRDIIPYASAAIGLPMAGGIVGREALKVGEKLALEAAERGAVKGVERGMIGEAERGLAAGADRGLTGETERVGLGSAEEAAAPALQATEGAAEATSPTLYKPVEEAFHATPEPAEVRTMAVDHITESIEATDGAAAQLPTKLGLGPMYVVDSGVEPTEKGFLLNSTKNANAERQLAGISPLLEEFPDMALDPQQWAQGMAKAFGSKDVVAPPYRFMKAIENGEYTELLKGLTEGQIADADAGFRAGKDFLNAYHTGKMRVEDTGKLFMWGIMSRGVNPFTHEGLFLDAFQGIEPFIKMASEGKFTEEIAAGPYKEWAATTAPKGSGQPGAGAMHNLNAFGEDFLVKMGTPGKDGITPMQKLHDLMSDPQMSGRDIRREFAKVGEGVGIDNKVVSFILLATGRDDVMVIDRIQLKNVFDDGRYADINIWDGISVPTVELADGTTKRFPPTEAGRAAQREFIAANEGAKGGNAAVTGSSLAEATYGAKGILVYEALEDALMKNVGKMYEELGRPEAASPGRFHWETWVARSNQEASHGTLPAILAQAKGAENPLEGIYSKQGDYQTYAYGAKYFRGKDDPYFMMPRSDGSEARLSVAEMSRLQDYLQDHTKGAIPTPTPSVVNPVTGEAREFANTPAGRAEANAHARELTEQARRDAAAANPSLDKKAISAIKIPVKDRGFAVTSAEGRPWHEDPTVNRERVDKLINDAEHRTEAALRQPAEGAVSDGAGSTVARARAAEGFGSGIPRTYGLVDQTVRGRALRVAPPAFDAPIKDVYQPNRKASRVYNADGKSTPPVYELGAGDQSAQVFHSAIKDAKDKSKFGAAVSLYDPAEYKDMRLFLTPDGTAGFALKGDDIVSVFNKPGGPHKGVSNPLLDLAIAQGGRKLDAYDTVLPSIYGESGFKTTSRMSFNPEYAPTDWSTQTFGPFNKGKPDVLHMVYDPRHDGSYSLGDGKFFHNYDDAVAHQEKNVKTTVNQLEKSRKAVAKAEKLKAQKKAEREATKAAQAAPKEGFAQGGAVDLPDQVSAVAHNLAEIAHRDRLDQRHLAYLLKVASGTLMPPERAMEYAAQIMTGDTNGLMQRFQTYVPSARTFARLNEMLGGKHKFMSKGNMGKEMQRMKGVDALQRTKDAIDYAMDSDVVRDRPAMLKALKKLSKGL